MLFGCLACVERHLDTTAELTFHLVTHTAESAVEEAVDEVNRTVQHTNKTAHAYEGVHFLSVNHAVYLNLEIAVDFASAVVQSHLFHFTVNFEVYKVIIK